MADNSLQIAQQHLQKAIALTEAAHYQESLDILEGAASVFEEMEEWKHYIQTLNGIAENHNELGNPSKAIENLNLAFQIAKQKGLADHPHLSFTFNRLGRSYSLQSEYQAELDAYENALKIASKNPQKDALALTYSNLGMYFNKRGNYTKAIDYHQKSLQTYLQLGEEYEDDIAACYNNLGGCYCNLGDYAQALPHFQKTLHTWLQSLTPNHPHFIYAYNNIASCYYFKEEYDAAIPYFQKALEVVEKNFGVNHGLNAAISINLGNCYKMLQEYEKALQCYHQTTKVHQVLYSKGQKLPKTVFNNYISLANCYIEQGLYDKAFSYLQQALEGYQAIFGENNPKLADVLNRIAYAYLKQGEEPEAIAFFHKSLNAQLAYFQSSEVHQYPKASKMSFSKPLLFAINRKSLSFYRLYQKNQKSKDLQAAFEGYVTLVEFIDAKRQDFKAYDSKLDLGEQLVGIYEKAIEVAVLMAKNADSFAGISSLQSLQTAFDFAEKSKAVLLLADLKEAEARANIPAKMREEEEDLKKNLLELEKKIQEGKLKESSKEVLQWEGEHFEVQQKYLRLIEQFEKDYPDYHQLKYSTQTAKVADLQAYLKTLEGDGGGEVSRLKGKTAVLSYYVGKEFVFVFCISALDFEVYQVPKAEHLEGLVNDFLDAINAVDIDDFVEIAEELQESLLKPIEGFVGEKFSQLIVLRHGILNYLPFDALLWKQEEGDFEEEFTDLPYLIRYFQISYHYSATLLLHQSSKKARHTFLADSFLGIAPVSFSEEEQARVALVSRGGATKVLRSNRAGEKALQNLPNTENEVKAVFELFRSRELEAKIFLYASASKQNLFLEAPHYKYILISTHGLTHSENDKLSGIYLAKPSEKQAENSSVSNDYLLYTSETYHLRLQADLVILSSCSSGIGKLYSAEGMMALHRGFLYAGANNIIFTQFDIPDESSSALVKKLFTYILEGNDYATALQKSKMDLLVNDAYTPQDWAGFLLIGVG